MSPGNGRTIITGVPAAPGLAVGRVCFWSDPESIPRYAIAPEMVKNELKRLDEALAQSRRQLADLRQRVTRELGADEAAIFSSHAMLLDDPAFYAKVEKRLITENLNLEAVVEEAVEEMVKIFKKIPDAYLRERADDYRDVGRRLLENLLSYQRQCAVEEGEQIVLVAHELMPSDTVHFHRQHIGAFVTDRGGVSSHAAILARSLRIPAVVGAHGILTRLRAGDLVLVDGHLGKIVVGPSEEEIAQARRDQALHDEARTQPRIAQVSMTRDGTPIRLLANLTREDEAAEARRAGALGVGLLRTEFLFMDRGEFLDEEAQYRAYRHVVETVAPHPVTIRTLDLGEDKQFPFENPVESTACILGWRSLRLSFANHGVFLAQLRAIVRASAHGPVRILLPMVASVEDVRLARSLLKQAAEEVRARGLEAAEDIPLGAMVETPAAAIRPELILQEADFLSVGTNDLVQYILVADRVAGSMQAYYRPASPSVLTLLKSLAEAAQSAGKEISLCGEIAGDPMFLTLLVGLGYRYLSVAPVLIQEIDLSLRRIGVAEAQALAAKCLGLGTTDEIEDLLRRSQPSAVLPA